MKGTPYINEIHDVFIGEKRAFVVHKRESNEEFICDLYDFANRKGAFTENEIGQIAY